VTVDISVVGAGVVGCATALALSRRGAAVALLEAEAEPGLGASGTNSGILHTGFDSIPGQLETDLILRAGELRDPVLGALGVPVLRCGGLLRAERDEQRATVAMLAANAERNGVLVRLTDEYALEVPGESVTDPVTYTLALADAAVRHGADVHCGFRVAAIERAGEGFAVQADDGDAVRCRIIVNCAGLRADEVARMAGDDSFEVYPRKGEFLVFDNTGLGRILLPVPTKRTKGVLVFPTVDGHMIAGPTAVDIEDKDDWSVRPEARDEILPKAAELWPPIGDAEQVSAYSGLRPAGRGVNYVIGRSAAAPGLVNVAAIRSTGLTASLGIADHVCGLIEGLGPEQPLIPAPPPPRIREWWRRTAELHAA
jgi:glycerol-3-phosphate dehydrogenase